MIRFRCRECGKKLKADEDIIGRKVQCTRCDNVETVPPFDDLTKSESAQDEPDHQAANKPNPADAGSAASSSFDDLSDVDSLLGEGHSIEMMEGLTDGPGEIDTNLPQFKQYHRKKTDFKRLIPFGLIGLAVVGISLIAINAGWIFNSGPTFDSEFEALPAVANYRRAQNQLEKSRRVMEVMGNAQISRNLMSQERTAEFNEFNESILVLTKQAETLTEASRLVDQGEQEAANRLLTEEANIMDDRKFTVDQKTEQYNE